MSRIETHQHERTSTCSANENRLLCLGLLRETVQSSLETCKKDEIQRKVSLPKLVANEVFRRPLARTEVPFLDNICEPLPTD